MCPVGDWAGGFGEAVMMVRVGVPLVHSVCGSVLVADCGGLVACGSCGSVDVPAWGEVLAMLAVDEAAEVRDGVVCVVCDEF
jgi:hypothetical protein